MSVTAQRMVAGARSSFRFKRRHLLKYKNMVICKDSAEVSWDMDLFTHLARVTECNAFAATDTGPAAAHFYFAKRVKVTMK